MCDPTLYEAGEILIFSVNRGRMLGAYTYRGRIHRDAVPFSLHARLLVGEVRKCQFGKSSNASGRTTGLGSDPRLKLID